MRPTQQWCSATDAERNAEILRLRGTMTMAKIAEGMGLRIGVIAGVCFRATRTRSPRSRKAKPPEVMKTVCLPEALYREIDKAAKRKGTSFSAFCRDAARHAVIHGTALPSHDRDPRGE
jgi:hypothetical protein